MIVLRIFYKSSANFTTFTNLSDTNNPVLLTSYISDPEILSPSVTKVTTYTIG